MKFKKEKVLHLRQTNSRQHYMPGAGWLENSFAEKDLKFLSSKLNMLSFPEAGRRPITCCEEGRERRGKKCLSSLPSTDLKLHHLMVTAAKAALTFTSLMSPSFLSSMHSAALSHKGKLRLLIFPSCILSFLKSLYPPDRNTPVMGAIPPHLCDSQKIVALQLHKALEVTGEGEKKKERKKKNAKSQKAKAKFTKRFLRSFSNSVYLHSVLVANRHSR
ncbi:hypothetical protein QYF61_011896 [Mycteria americana]|uniref:Uncharacterized protein n=1 Tax=Mycteria americana TaxID=33587 RepID=A0AAN7NJS5_MYCAM|nr:hypothetical protein QYF61_011896 [Mycteria americana]